MIRTLAEVINGQEVMHVSLPMITTFTTAIIAAIGMIFVRGQRREQRLRESIRIEHPVPEVPVHLQGGHVAVSMPEKFLTRSDFLEYKSDIKSDIREMRVLYDKALCLMTDLGESLHKRISENEESGAERRRRIHDKLNEHSDQLSRIDSRTEVSKSIGKLGAAIMTLAKKD